MDLGDTAPPARPGTTYALGAWYRSTARTQFALYYRTQAGQWTYWASSPYFQPSAEWKQAQWVTAPAPDDATALSFGLALPSNGTLITDDYSLQPTAAAGNCHQSPWWSPRRWFCW